MFARLLAGLVLGLLMYIPRVPDPDVGTWPKLGPKDDPPTPDSPPDGDGGGVPPIDIDPPIELDPPTPNVPPTPPPGYEGDWPPASEHDGPPSPPSIFDRIRDIGRGVGKLVKDPDFREKLLLRADASDDAGESAKLVRSKDSIDRS